MTLTVTISSASKSALRQPVALEFPGKSAAEVTIRDVKVALASKVKKVRNQPFRPFLLLTMLVSCTLNARSYHNKGTRKHSMTA